MSDGLQILLGSLIGYVIGMFPSADLVARLASRGAVDLRESGSGNPGGLNAARVLGKKWGLLVIVMDAAKGALAGVVGLAMGDPGAYAAGTAVIAGHCWPVYNGFRGGKGVAAAGGSFFSVFPPMVPDRRAHDRRGGVPGQELAAGDQGGTGDLGRGGRRRGGRPTGRCGGVPSRASGS